MMRLVLAVPRLPYPAVSGGELRVTALFERLSRRMHIELISFSNNSSAHKETAFALWLERTCGARLTLVTRTPGAFEAAPRELPSIARSYYDPAMASALARAAANHKNSIIQLEFSQFAQYAEMLAPTASVLLTEHDTGLLSPFRSYERPKPNTRIRQFIDTWRARRHLKRAYAACNRVIAVSTGDARRLKNFCPAAKVSSIPTGVDLNRFSFQELAGREPGLVVFLGHYPHYPNEEAALRLCRDVLPRLRALDKRASVRLVGSDPTPAVRALASLDVEITGTVTDVRPFLATARVFAAPMRLGRGIKGKILEAFALGTPVVASPEAMDAMDGAEDGRHYLLASNPESFARATARLLSNDALSARLAAEARQYVEKYFNWDIQADRLYALYEAVSREEAAADGKRL